MTNNLIKYTAGSNKGQTAQGDVFNDPFRLGKVDPQYTSSRVTDTYTLAEDTETFTMNWKPVVKGTISVTAGGTTYVDDGAGKVIAVPAGGRVSRRTVMVQPVEDPSNMGDLRLEGTTPVVETVVFDATGAAVTTAAGEVDYATGVITFTTAVKGDVQVAYSYNNAVIPQNDLPILNARMESMPLLARARRIAIYYLKRVA